MCDPPRTRRPTLGVHFGAQRTPRRPTKPNSDSHGFDNHGLMCAHLVFVKYELITSLFFRRPQNRSPLPSRIASIPALIT